MLTQIAQTVLAEYPGIAAANAVTPLGTAGGLSGSTFWRIRNPSTPFDFCLRCWPEDYPARERLPWMHSVLTEAFHQGCQFVPVPYASQASSSYVITNRSGRVIDARDVEAEEANLRYWEVTPWLPGQPALVQTPTNVCVSAAMVALARFHRATADLGKCSGAVPGIVDRRQRILQLRKGGASKLSVAIRQATSHPCFETALRILELFNRYSAIIEAELLSAAEGRHSLQPCIRDVRPEHFLFVDEKVHGLIDYGALRIDHVAGDVARLLGELGSNWQEPWSIALEIYGDTFRPLESGEVQMIQTFDRATTLLASMNWLEWIFVERRRFDAALVAARLNHLVARLQSIYSSGNLL